MQKVKVQRYVTGKRPDYAPSSDEEYVSDDEFVAQQQQPAPAADEVELTEQERDDPRLRRLQRLQQQRQEQEEEEEKEERDEAAADSDASDSAPRRRYGTGPGVGRGGCHVDGCG